MGEERIEVGRLDHLGRAGKGLIHIAVVLEHLGARALGQLGGRGGEALARLCGGGPFVPGDHELPPGALRHPPAVGHDRNAAQQPGQIAPALDHESIADAGERLDLIDVGRGHLAAEDRALGEHGVPHARDLDVDAEERPARQDARIVDAGDRRADDGEFLGILEPDGLQVGRGNGRRLGDELAVTQLPAARLVEDGGGGGGALRFGHAPGEGGRRHQHLPGGGADSAELVVVHRGGHTSAGELTTVLGIGVGLFDPDRLPLDVEFLGDQHREHGLDALADLGILGDDGDGAVGADPDVDVRLEFGDAALAGSGRQVRSEQQAAGGEGGDLEEGAAIDSRGGHGATAPVIPAARWIASRIRM